MIQFLFQIVPGSRVDLIVYDKGLVNIPLRILILVLSEKDIITVCKN